MRLERETTILRLMDELKWSDKFICLKCGNKSYIPGKEAYSRRCRNSKCKKEVSLTKYTAFEGLRFPINKAYGILEHLIEHAVLDSNAKVIKWYNRSISGTQGFEMAEEIDEWEYPSNVSDKYKYISLYDLLYLSKDNKWGEGKFEEKAEEIKSRWQPSIGSLSKRFELEENTIAKFLEKINYRMRSVYRYEHINPLNRLLEFIDCYTPKKIRENITAKYFLGLAMVPMIGEWKYGITKVDKKNYGIDVVEDGDGEWSVFRITGSRDDHKYTFHIHEQIEYGTEEWCRLFLKIE